MGVDGMRSGLAWPGVVGLVSSDADGPEGERGELEGRHTTRVPVSRGRQR